MAARADDERGEAPRARRAAANDVREGGTWTRGQRLKNDLLYVLIRVLLAAALVLPRRAVRASCRALGLFAYLLLGKVRADVEARLCAGLGRPGRERCRHAFVMAGEMLADMIALLRPDERAGAGLVMDTASRRVFEEALAEGRGVVFVAAHIGPWERMAALLVEEGFPVATVARESYDPRLTEIYERLRRPRGVRSLYRGRPGASMAIARELAKGRAVGFLVDLPARVPSSSRPLFGDDAPIPLGPARIALARRAAVVVGTCAPQCELSNRAAPALPWVHIRRISSADLQQGTESEDVLVNRITEEVERRIVAWPEAWVGLFVPRRLRRARDRR